jgi:hypothetical protein
MLDRFYVGFYLTIWKTMGMKQLMTKYKLSSNSSTLYNVTVLCRSILIMIRNGQYPCGCPRTVLPETYTSVRNKGIHVTQHTSPWKPRSHPTYPHSQHTNWIFKFYSAPTFYHTIIILRPHGFHVLWPVSIHIYDRSMGRDSAVDITTR